MSAWIAGVKSSDQFKGEWQLGAANNFEVDACREDDANGRWVFFGWMIRLDQHFGKGRRLVWWGLFGWLGQRLASLLDPGGEGRVRKVVLPAKGHGRE